MVEQRTEESLRGRCAGGGCVPGVGGMPIRQLEPQLETQVEITTVNYLHGREEQSHEYQ